MSKRDLICTPLVLAANGAFWPAAWQFILFLTWLEQATGVPVI